MNTRIFSFCMVVAISAASQAEEPTDFEKIQGFWQATSIEADEKPDDEAAVDDVRFLFERDMITSYQGGKRIGAYRFSLDSTKPLPEIDLALPDDPKPETSNKGIYRLQGDSLKLCIGHTRPSEFRGIDGAWSFVFTRPEPEVAIAVPAWCLDVSPDGQRLAMAGGERSGRGLVTLLDAKDWSVALSHLEQRAATCVAFSPNGEKLAIGNQIGEVAILDLKTQTVAHRWHTEKWAVFGITWTPDNRDVIAACANGVIKRFRAETGALHTTFNTWEADGKPNPRLGGHGDRNLWDVAVSQDGNTLLSGGWNGTTRLWEMTTGELKHTFFGVDESTQGVKFTPDERHFVSNGMMGNGSIVRATDTRDIRADLNAAGRDVAVHPGGELIAASTLSDVRIFRLKLGVPNAEQRAEIRRLISELADDEASVAAAEELQRIGLPADTLLQEASRTAEGAFLQRVGQVQEAVRSPTPIATLDGHQGEVRQVVFSPTGNFMATSTITGDVRIWNPESFQLVHQVTLKLGSTAKAPVPRL